MLVLLGPHAVRASVVGIAIGQRVQETERAKKKDTAQNDRKPLSTRLNSIRGLLAVTLLVFLATAAGAGGIAPDLFSLHDVRQFIRSSIFVCNQNPRRILGFRPVDCQKFPPGPDLRVTPPGGLAREVEIVSAVVGLQFGEARMAGAARFAEVVAEAPQTQ